MRKILSILLVAVLAAGTTFAAFSGEASLGFGGNLDNGNFGFIDQAAKVKVNVDVATASAEAIADGSVYASIKASLGLVLFNGQKGSAESGDPSLINGSFTGNYRLGVIADITEAKVAGENWYVSILGVPGGPDYAKSAIDTYDAKGILDKWGFEKSDYTEAYTYSAAYQKATGVEVGLYDYKIGFGLLGDYTKGDTWKLKDNLNLSVFAETPSYEFVEGLTTQVGAVYSYKTIDKITDGVPAYVDSETNSFGLSAKFGYVKDALNIAVASDLGFDFTKEGVDMVGADVAATVSYDFLTFDAYYATAAKAGIGNKAGSVGDTVTTVTKDDYLSAQVKTDLNRFNVPVALTIAVKDIIATQNISANVETKPVDGLKITVKGGYTVDNKGRSAAGTMISDKGRDLVGKWSAGLSGEYEMDIFKVAAGVSLSQEVVDGAKVVIGGNASIESSALVPGATLKLAWAGDDVTRANSTGYLDEDNGDRGKITASCKITF